MDGTLLYCPNCQYSPKPQVLGRLLSNGDLMILRFHSGTTVLHSEHYDLRCGCGFTYSIDGTVILGTVKYTV